jgi:hypothetical protein
MVLPLPADLEVLLVSLHSMVLQGLAELVVPGRSTLPVAVTAMVVEVTVLRRMLCP